MSCEASGGFRCASERAEGNRALSRVYDFSQVSLLLVEDNDFMARLLTSMLSALRFGTVLRARDGLEAKALIEAKASGGAVGGYGIDAVISDWLMEPIDGLELLKWIRGHPKDQIKYLPFVMQTSYPERQRVVTARDAGATEFLRKPVKLEAVIARLVEIIERPRPFVRCDTYFGPDRRRKSEPFEGPDRRAKAEAPEPELTAQAANG